MNPNYKADERELVKVATFFKKKAKQLIGEGKLGEENRQVEAAVDKFIEHLDEHADTRAHILKEREQLGKLVKDNAECPKCKTRDMIKLVGTDKDERGWKSNRYKCRKCNIQFTWNRPNNPWDMIQYIEEVMTLHHVKTGDTTLSSDEREQIAATIQGMEDNLAKLKPVIESHDREYEALQVREGEMAKAVHEFKNTLLIEKIKMDTWENKHK
ncbi:hypothetical protein [Pseudochryseolinea flava]|uniref:Uncharacterized protein n=1 Tax=Pseudochryseolinea flava TaxID=2059302 RepID=A0A364Y1G2_9BACT|nr:hypothetical protein [Pseudochryseolinea flava]RAW00441.1 hypothetical protein DQQ10_15465 [Pseudochryseolinea flava]